MPDVWFAVPGDIETLTGGYIYAKRLIGALPGAGWTPHLVRLPGSYPAPSAHDLLETRQALESLPQGAIVLADGLAFGAIPHEILGTLDVKFIALVHHPLALESGLSDADAEKFLHTEREALAKAKAVVTTGPDTARILVDRYNVPQEKISVAMPGTDPAPRAALQGSIPQLLTVATVTRRKGHDVLVEALARVSDVSWRSVCVGSLDRDPELSSSIRALITEKNLEDRIELRGEVAGQSLSALYQQSDIFILPSRHEGYGMAFAEALAHGLPILACAAGAVPDTVPPEAGILVPPDSPGELASALREMLTDTAKRKDLAEGSWAYGQSLPRWSDTASAIAKALAAVQ